MSNVETESSERVDLLNILSSQVETVPVPEQLGANVAPPAIPKQLVEFNDEQATGKLLPETRRALVALLRHGVIMASNKRQLFDTLCREQVKIQSHLADMYLYMLLVEPGGLAMLLQQEEMDTDEEGEVSKLITRRTLTLFDTLLLLVLRKHYQDRENAGEQRVIVDVDSIEIGLLPFVALTNSSQTDRKKLNAALKKMKERRILTEVHSEEDRFEITPVIRHVVNASFLEQMLGEYQALAGQTSSELTVEVKNG